MDNQPEVQKKMLGVTSNIVILSGRLGGDAQWRSTTQGREYLSFTLGTVRYSYVATDEQSGTTSREDVMDWHECRIYNLPYADAMQTYLTKGSFVTVKGELRAVRWTDEQGSKHSSVYVEVGEIAVIEDRIAAVAVVEQPTTAQSATLSATITPIRSRRPSRVAAQAAYQPTTRAARGQGQTAALPLLACGAGKQRGRTRCKNTSTLSRRSKQDEDSQQGAAYRSRWWRSADEVHRYW